jgi:hypothetical protein
MLSFACSCHKERREWNKVSDNIVIVYICMTSTCENSSMKIKTTNKGTNIKYSNFMF